MTRFEFTRILAARLLDAGYTRGTCLRWNRPDGTRITRAQLVPLLWEWSADLPAHHRQSIGRERFWNQLSYRANGLLTGVL